MLGRPRFRMLRLGLPLAAQGTGERANEILTSNPIGHHPLERTTNPALILTNQVGRGLSLAHALGISRIMSEGSSTNSWRGGPINFESRTSRASTATAHDLRGPDQASSIGINPCRGATAWAGFPAARPHRRCRANVWRGRTSPAGGLK